MINIQKQEELRKFVEEEVYTCQSMLVEEALKKEFFSWDDVENLYRPFDGELLSPNVCNTCKLVVDNLDSETGQCKDCYSDNQELHEIYEWWVVSDWLEILLLKRDEPLLRNEYGTWWGRCTTGQAIFMDRVISDIYDEVMNY
jgi:hypothetical protein